MSDPTVDINEWCDKMTTWLKEHPNTLFTNRDALDVVGAPRRSMLIESYIDDIILVLKHLGCRQVGPAQWMKDEVVEKARGAVIKFPNAKDA
jgi:hypothetical protein